MTREEFVDAVMRRLPNIPDQRDVDLIRSEVESLFNSGWRADEIVRYVRFIENVDPDLNEAYALARLQEIRLAVEARLSSEKERRCDGNDPACPTHGVAASNARQNERMR